MKLAHLVLATAAIAAPVMTVPAVAAPRTQTVTVVMADNHFDPQVIRLRAGQRYRIVLVNRDSTGHNFDSKGFFANAETAVDGPGGQAVADGLISVPAYSTISFRTTPITPGPYNLTSSVALDTVSGMQGQILVY